MDKVFWLLIPLAMFQGCGGFDSSREVYVCENKPEVARLIIECASAANPLSDEEGEDLVAQCEHTMKRALCEVKLIKLSCDHFGGYCREVGPSESQGDDHAGN